MIHVCRIGPVETDEGNVFAYVAMSDATPPVPVRPVFARRDAEGLRQIAAECGGEELLCEPDLARAGRPLGFRPAELSESVKAGRAVLALAMALSEPLARVRRPQVLGELLDACAQYAYAGPFRFWGGEQRIEAELGGAKRGRFDCAILGNGEAEIGAVLYLGRGGFDTVLRHALEGAPVEDAVDAVLVTLEREPAFAAKAMEDVTGLYAVPVPLRTRKGRPPKGPSETEVLALVAVLRAASGLSPGCREAGGYAQVDRTRVTAILRAPEPLPEEPKRDARPAGVGRNDPRLRGSGRKHDWYRSVAELHSRPAPVLQNTDGDAFLWTIDHYALDPAERDEVVRRLKRLEGAQTEGHARATRVVFVRSGHAVLGSSDTIIGGAEVSRDRMRLESNSVVRADALRARVEEACGDVVRHRLREHQDPLSEARERVSSGPPHEPSPEEAEMVRETKEQIYSTWPDEPLPALGGRTAREAVRTRRGREKVDLLLREMENHEARLPEAQRFDFSKLRRALRLDRPRSRPRSRPRP